MENIDDSDEPDEQNKNIYRYVTGQTRAVSWHRLYTVQFVKCNGDKRLHS